MPKRRKRRTKEGMEQIVKNLFIDLLDLEDQGVLWLGQLVKRYRITYPRAKMFMERLIVAGYVCADSDRLYLVLRYPEKATL